MSQSNNGFYISEENLAEIEKMPSPELPQKGILWRIKNSWYTLLAFFYPLSFLSFFYIGFRVNRLKWKLAGVLYMLLLLSPIIGFSKFIGVSILAYFVSIVHIFVCRKEYLIRLNIYQNVLDKAQDRVLRESIQQEYVSNPKKAVELKESLPSKPLTPPLPNEFILKIRSLNVTITDEAVSARLDNIESVLTNIFDYVQEYPEKQDSIRTLNNYYIPEVIKLLERYIELSNKSVRTAQMTATMGEIENALATVTAAFHNLYNSLFNDVTAEVSTNITVLKDVLAQNGLIADKMSLDYPGKD